MISRLPLYASFVLSFAVSGCSSQGVTKVSKPSVDTDKAAAAAIASLDANGDGSLDATELAKCPPLLQVLATYDVSKDRKLAADELATRWGYLFGPSSAYTSVSGAVLKSGVPLAGAEIQLRPIDALKDYLPTAKGTTDDQGIVRPGIPADQLPAKLANASLAFPGLYHVEITHPDSQIPARYNTATELGWEIDPSARSAVSPRFDIKAN